MRGQALIDHVTQAIHDAFLSDEDTLNNLARHLNRNYDENGITAALVQVANNLDDDTADWLVEQADNPAAWLYSRV